MRSAAASVDPRRSFVKPPNHIVAQAGPARNRVIRGEMARPALSQNPNLAQIARVSGAEISSSGRPPIPSNRPSAEAPTDLRPRRPDSIPAAGATTGVLTL